MLEYSYVQNKLWIDAYSPYDWEINRYIQDILVKMEEYKIKKKECVAFGENYYNNDSISELVYLIWKMWEETWRFDKFKSSWLWNFIIDNFTRKDVYTWKRVFIKDRVNNLLNYFLIYLLLPQFFLNFYIQNINKINLNQVDIDLIYNCVEYLMEHWNIMMSMEKEKYLPSEELLLDKIWWDRSIVGGEDLEVIYAINPDSISKETRISDAWFWTFKLRRPFTSIGKEMVWVYKDFLKHLRDYFKNTNIGLKIFNLKNADFSSIEKITYNLLSILNVDNDIRFPRSFIPESWERYIKVFTKEGDGYNFSFISSIWFHFGDWINNYFTTDSFSLDTFAWLRYRTYKELSLLLWGKFLKLPWLIKITEKNINIIKKFINDKKGVHDFLYLFFRPEDTYDAVVCVRYI